MNKTFIHYLVREYDFCLIHVISIFSSVLKTVEYNLFVMVLIERALKAEITYNYYI